MFMIVTSVCLFNSMCFAFVLYDVRDSEMFPKHDFYFAANRDDGIILKSHKKPGADLCHLWAG